MRPITMMMTQKKPSTKQGTLLTFDNAVRSGMPTKAPWNLTAYGLCKQDGSPTPDAPVAVQSVNGNLDISDGTAVQQTAALPILRGIEVASTASPNVSWVDGGTTHYAVADTWEPDVMVGGVHRSRTVQRIGVKVFDGTETWRKYDAEHNVYLSNGPFNAEDGARYASRCSHYPWSPGNLLNNQDEHRFQSTTPPSKRIYISSSDIGSVADFKTFLAAQHAAGTPVTVYYVLATPVVTLGDPVPLETYHPITNIYTTSAVQGQLKATVLVPRH